MDRNQFQLFNRSTWTPRCWSSSENHKSQEISGSNLVVGPSTFFLSSSFLLFFCTRSLAINEKISGIREADNGKRKKKKSNKWGHLEGASKELGWTFRWKSIIENRERGHEVKVEWIWVMLLAISFAFFWFLLKKIKCFFQWRINWILKDWIRIWYNYFQKR